MITGKLEDLFQNPNISDKMKNYMKQRIFHNGIPKDFKNIEYSSFSVLPNNKPCLFYYDEETDELLFIYTTINYVKTSKRTENDKFKITTSINFIFKNPKSENPYYNIEQGNCDLFLQAKNRELIPYSKLTQDLNLISSKTNSLLMRASKFLPDVKKLLKFLNTIER